MSENYEFKKKLQQDLQNLGDLMSWKLPKYFQEFIIYEDCIKYR